MEVPVDVSVDESGRPRGSGEPSRGTAYVVWHLELAKPRRAWRVEPAAQGGHRSARQPPCPGTGARFTGEAARR